MTDETVFDEIPEPELSPPPAEGLLVSVEDAEPLLQAVSASAATAVMATMLPSRPVRPLFLRFNIIVLPFSFVR